MNVLRYLSVNVRSLNKLLTEDLVNAPYVIRTRQSKRNLIGETYEGTGKTTGYILNKKGIDVICIDYITTSGFVLTNGWTVLGPSIFFPHTIIGWKIRDLFDVNEDSLALFSLLRPKLDCLFIGYGSKEVLTYDKLRDLLQLCKMMKLNVELLRTETAAATFNFCSIDRKFVAAALIPPGNIQTHDLLKITDVK